MAMFDAVMPEIEGNKSACPDVAGGDAPPYASADASG